MKIHKITYIDNGHHFTRYITAKTEKEAIEILFTEIKILNISQAKEQEIPIAFMDFVESSIELSCKIFQIEKEVLFKRGKKGNIPACRQLVWLLVQNKFPNTTLSRLGAIFYHGHATVLWGLKTIKDRLKFDRELILDVSLLIDLKTINL